MHVYKYDKKDKNTVPYYDRNVIYFEKIDKDNRKYIEVAGFKPRNNKKGYNNKRGAKFVELIRIDNDKTRKEISEELQERHGKVPVFFWTLP